MLNYHQRLRQKEKETRELVEMFLPNWEDKGTEVIRQGVPRKRTRVNKAFHPYLTERQRTVLKGKPKMARAWQRILKTMSETGMTMEEFVATLSPEELVRGDIKNAAGHFGGRPPKWIPRAFHRACLNELMNRGRKMWQQNYLEAIEAMTEIASGRGAGKHATPNERIKAAQFVIERLEGKVPEKLQVTTDQPWMLVLDGIVAEVSDEAVGRGQRALESAQDVIEAEVIDEEYDMDMGDDVESEPPRPARSRRRAR